MKSIYKTYLARCKDNATNPIDKEDFDKVLGKQRKIISYMVSLGNKKPWIISRIDENYVLYASSDGEKVNVNIWTNKECEAFTGRKVGSDDKS